MDNPVTASAEVLLRDDIRVLSLVGRLTFANVRQVYRKVSRLLHERVEQVDCGGLEHADSTALALLLIIVGSETHNGESPRITGLNSRLQSLAQVYGIEEILGISTESRQ